MKKSNLIIAAAAALLVACAGKEEVNQISSQGPAIDFATYYQKATRATENSSENYDWDLSNHHSSFKVWGYKNTSATAVFGGEEVSWNTTNTAWEYINNRYWDKVADDYYFYACAPYTNSDSPFKFNGVTSIDTQDKGYFTVGAEGSLYNKAGENVSAYATSTADPKVASEDPVQSWTKAKENANDIDLMVAEETHMSRDNSSLIYDQKVQLNFIHILSRLNVTIKTVSGFDPTKTTDDLIVIDNITIGNMNKAGYFTENKTITNGTLAGGTYDRWTTSKVTGDVAYSYDLNYKADLTKKYVIEALMLPQVLEVETIKTDGSSDEKKPYLYIKYTISNHAMDENSKQVYEAYYNLATILTKKTDVPASNTAFNEGWQNTINITIDPDKIDFDANVAVWADTNNNDLTID